MSTTKSQSEVEERPTVHARWRARDSATAPIPWWASALAAAIDALGGGTAVAVRLEILERH